MPIMNRLNIIINSSSRENSNVSEQDTIRRTSKVTPKTGGQIKKMAPVSRKTELSEEAQSVRIMKNCPRFDKCSAPLCPLDPKQTERDVLPEEPKCPLSKKRRFEIGQGTDLPFQGLTQREWAAKIREASLSEEAKQLRNANLCPFDAKQKGGNNEDA